MTVSPMANPTTCAGSAGIGAPPCPPPLTIPLVQFKLLPARQFADDVSPPPVLSQQLAVFGAPWPVTKVNASQAGRLQQSAWQCCGVLAGPVKTCVRHKEPSFRRRIKS